MFVTINNGQDIKIKQLGAYSLALVVDKVFDLLDGVDLNKFDTADINQTEALKLIRTLVSKKRDVLVDIIVAVSELTAEQIKIDGNEAVTIDDWVSILQSAWELNGSQIMGQLGNVESLPKAVAGANKNKKK